MLYSILKECELTTRNGQKVGNITNLLVNTRETPWTVKKITFKTRALGRKTFAFPIDRVEKINKTQKTVLVIGYVEPEPSPTLPEVDATSLTDLTKKTAVSEDGENIGKISDFDISTLTKPWTVNKIIIKTGIKKRRLRISVDRVKQVEKNVIIKAK
jgi:sporulation protein YlmC with PRC-barrel domain